MARILSADSELPSFDHYDAAGNAIDTNGDIMPGMAQAPQPPDWQIATGAGAAPAGTFLPDWRPGEPDQAGATDATGTPYPAVSDPANAPARTTDPGTTAPPPATTTIAPATGGGGTGGSATDNPFGPWTGHYTAPTPAALPDVPVFDYPAYVTPPAFTWGPDTPGYVAKPTLKQADPFTFDPFVKPTMEDVLNDPGYQFRVQQGTTALQNAASARGTLGDSGTLKALMDYGQNAASQEYQDVWNRDYTGWKGNVDTGLAAYTENYKTQYSDPYTFGDTAATDAFNQAIKAYDTNVTSQYHDPYALGLQRAEDIFAPVLAGYKTSAQNVLDTNARTNTNSWNDYALGFQDWQNRRGAGVQVALGS